MLFNRCFICVSVLLVTNARAHTCHPRLTHTYAHTHIHVLTHACTLNAHAHTYSCTYKQNAEAWNNLAAQFVYKKDKLVGLKEHCYV